MTFYAPWVDFYQDRFQYLYINIILKNSFTFQMPFLCLDLIAFPLSQTFSLNVIGLDSPEDSQNEEMTMTFLIHLLFQKMHADFLYTVS